MYLFTDLNNSMLPNTPEVKLLNGFTCYRIYSLMTLVPLSAIEREGTSKLHKETGCEESPHLQPPQVMYLAQNLWSVEACKRNTPLEAQLR
jgi:hypothetical protein